MFSKPIFLNPVFKERIWGGTRLREEFPYDIPSNNIGECWGISAHPHGQSIVKNGKFEGLTLSDLWVNYPELFGEQNEKEFPLLVKILDANHDLSVQVHPNDEFALKFENGEKGKTECWYIIDCKEDAEIILGHRANSLEDFIEFIKLEKWDSLLRRIKIKPGDFYYVPSGTIHAICEGTLILETQQSSDTTYRLYDYGRIDDMGQKRELHIEKAINAISIPHRDYPINFKENSQKGLKIITFIKDKYFSVYRWDIAKKAILTQDKPFMLCSVINGNGELEINNDYYNINKGDHFILPNQLGDFHICGNVSLIVSHV